MYNFNVGWRENKMYSKDKKLFNNRKIFIQNDYECIDDGTGVKYIHRLIMEQHLGRKLSSEEEVHHKDRNKRNNSTANFKLTTKSLHSKLHWNSNIRPIQKGSKNSQSKLTENQVIEIISKVKNSKDIKDIADEYNVGFHCIWDIWKGKSWIHIPRELF